MSGAPYPEAIGLDQVPNWLVPFGKPGAMTAIDFAGASPVIMRTAILYGRPHERRLLPRIGWFRSGSQPAAPIREVRRDQVMALTFRADLLATVLIGTFTFAATFNRSGERNGGSAAATRPIAARFAVCFCLGRRAPVATTA
jgi:hypothetical protein